MKRAWIEGSKLLGQIPGHGETVVLAVASRRRHDGRYRWHSPLGRIGRRSHESAEEALRAAAQRLRWAV
jgi:hypothetical protein